MKFLSLLVVCAVGLSGCVTGYGQARSEWSALEDFYLESWKHENLSITEVKSALIIGDVTRERSKQFWEHYRAYRALTSKRIAEDHLKKLISRVGVTRMVLSEYGNNLAHDE